MLYNRNHIQDTEKLANESFKKLLRVKEKQEGQIWANIISEFQKMKYTDLKALLMMMTEFYSYPGHDCRMLQGNFLRSQRRKH